MSKQAEALPTNTQTPGTMVLYEDPPNRPAHSLDAPWGEEPDRQQDHYGDAAWQGHRETQHGVVRRLFGTFDAAADNAKKTISQNFGTEYETRSPLLRPKTAAAHAPPGETLTDMTRRVCGRR